MVVRHAEGISADFAKCQQVATFFGRTAAQLDDDTKVVKSLIAAAEVLGDASPDAELSQLATIWHKAVDTRKAAEAAIADAQAALDRAAKAENDTLKKYQGFKTDVEKRRRDARRLLTQSTTDGSGKPTRFVLA